MVHSTLSYDFEGKARRGMLRRAVFSDIQRKGLERRFQVQKYISKPDRKKLADQLGLKDSQVRRLCDIEIILDHKDKHDIGLQMTGDSHDLFLGKNLVPKPPYEVAEQQGKGTSIPGRNQRADSAQ